MQPSSRAAEVPSPPLAGRASDLNWNWGGAVLGAAYALPAAAVALGDPARGVALSVGVLPAAIIGLLPTRHARFLIVVLGVLTGVPMFLGGLLAGVPVLAVAAVGGLGVGAAVLAGRSRIGQVAMVLSLPMFGVGLSYSEVGKAAGLAGLMVAGSLFACLVSMLWPDHPQISPRPAPGPAPNLDYGIRLGAAGATAAALGFILGLEHVGWACAAALLVMRPAAEMQRLRSAGRLLSVAIGAGTAILVIHLQPADFIYAVAVVASIGAAAATHRSRWYVTPAFTTFLVFLMLLYASPDESRSRFGERLTETAVGVALAYLFGLLVPRISADWNARRD